MQSLFLTSSLRMPCAGDLRFALGVFVPALQVSLLVVLMQARYAWRPSPLWYSNILNPPQRQPATPTIARAALQTTVIQPSVRSTSATKIPGNETAARERACY